MPATTTTYATALELIAPIPADELPADVTRKLTGAARLLDVAARLEIAPGSPAALQLSGLLEWPPEQSLAAIMLEAMTDPTALVDPPAEILRIGAVAGVIRVARQLLADGTRGAGSVLFAIGELDALATIATRNADADEDAVAGVWRPYRVTDRPAG